MKEKFGKERSRAWDFAVPKTKGKKKSSFIDIIDGKIPVGYRDKNKLERVGLFAEFEKAKTFPHLFSLSSSIDDFNFQIKERNDLLDMGIPSSEIWKFCCDRNESFTPDRAKPYSVPALVHTDIAYEEYDTSFLLDVATLNEEQILPVVIKDLWVDVGFDTEYISVERYQESGKTTSAPLSADKHFVLSYQYYAIFYQKNEEIGRISDVLIFDDDISVSQESGEGPRLTLGELLHIVLDKANREGFKTIWEPIYRKYGQKFGADFDFEMNWQPLPANINLIAHFSRADLSSLKDYHTRKTPKGASERGFGSKLSHIRKTDSSTEAFAIYPDGLESQWVNEKIFIKVRDTKNLCPGTKSSLKELGETLNLPKLDLQEIIPTKILEKDFPSGRAIEAMDILLEKHPALFALYSLRDAEVVSLYCKELRNNLEKADMIFKKGQPNELPVTLSGLGPQYARERLWKGFSVNQKAKAAKGDLPITRDEWNAIQEIYPPETHIGKDVEAGKTRVHRFPLDTFLHRDSATKRTKGYGETDAVEYKMIPWTARRGEVEEFLGNGYYGGRNEQFFYGITSELPKGELWYDYDLAGAYTTAMMGIGCWKWNEVKEWVDGVAAETIEETFLDFENGYGVARVEFQFPEGTKYPCIPYRKQSSSLSPSASQLLSTIIFPLEGIGSEHVYATNVEIALAKQMGATVNYHKAVYVPMDRRYSPYAKLIQLVGEKRKFHKQAGDKFQDVLWKEVGNSLYGQTARGIRPRKEGFDLETQTRSERYLPASKVSCSITAGYTTAIVRAVLGALMWKIDTFSDEKKVLISNVTTDGFLTDFSATEEQWKTIWNSNDILKHFYHCRSQIDGQDGRLDQYCSFDSESDKSSVLKIKHQSRQHIGFRTRGQFSLVNSFEESINDNLNDFNANFEERPIQEVDGSIRILTKSDLEKIEQIANESGEGGVSAKAGNKSLIPSLTKSYFTQAFIERESDWKMARTLLSTIGEQLFGGGDLVNKDNHVKVSMDFDFKRLPIWNEVSIREIEYFSIIKPVRHTDDKGKKFQNVVEIDTLNLERKKGKHIYFETKPLKDYAEYELHRAALAEFTKKYVLKTKEDVKMFRHLVELANQNMLHTFRRQGVGTQRRSSRKKGIDKDESFYNDAAKHIRKMLVTGQHGWTLDTKFKEKGWKIQTNLMKDIIRMLYPKTIEEEVTEGKSSKLARLTQNALMSLNQDYKRFRQAVLNFPKENGFKEDAEFEVLSNNEAIYLRDCPTSKSWFGVMAERPDIVSEILRQINAFELKSNKLLGWSLAVKQNCFLEKAPKLPLNDPYRFDRFKKLNNEWFGGKLNLAKFLSDT